MSLRDQLESDIRDAMRGREQQRLDALRYLKSYIQSREKTLGETLDDAATLEAINKQVNDRRESIRMFKEGGRTDLVEKEAVELAILETYLPPQLSADELAVLVKGVIQEVGATTIRDKGKVMGRLMPEVRGKADGTEVNTLVTELLEAGN